METTSEAPADANAFTNPTIVSLPSKRKETKNPSETSATKGAEESLWTPPPSSVEEAAALLGTCITRLDSVQAYRTTAPPHGLHSSFSTVEPVPCSELYVRLASLSNLLQHHLDESLKAKHDNPNDKAFMDSDVTLEAAPSIIPVLHKLFTISSSLALTPVLLHSSSTTLPAPSNPLQSIATSTNSSTATESTVSMSGSTENSSNGDVRHPNAHMPRSEPFSGTDSQASSASGMSGQTSRKDPQVPPVRITPPLSSKPIRYLWVKCITLAHRLSSPQSLPSTNPHVLLAPYFSLVASHPRSAKSAGGSRVAALALLVALFQDEVLGARYIRPLLPEITTLCHGALRSSGATDVVHRTHAVQFALTALMAWRDAPSPIVRREEKKLHFLKGALDNCIDEKVLAECVKLLRKAADDKYPEVRLAAAELACVLSNVSVTEEPRSSSSNKKEYNSLMYLDDVMATCLRNMDDESAGVSATWSEAFARCVCAAVEYHSNMNRNGLQNVGRVGGGSGSDNASSASGNKNDFTSKIKAFNEARKAMGTIGSVSCMTLDSAMDFVVQQYIKVGGEGASKMGGSHSMGGRHAQIGISLALVHLCRFQLETGGIGFGSDETMSCTSPTDALNIVMKMVSRGLDQDTDTSNGSMSSLSMNGFDNSMMEDVTSSPKRKNLADKASSVGGFLKNISGNITEPKHRSPSDASLARLGTCRVLRRGLSEMMSETMQLSILRDLANSCRPTEANGGIAEYNRHQVQVAMVEISHLVTTLGDACASCLNDLLPALQACVSDPDHGVRHEAAVAFQSVAVAFPSAGRKYIMTVVGEIQVHQDEVLALGAVRNISAVNSIKGADSTPNHKRRNRRRQGQEKNNLVIPVDSNVLKSLDHQYAIHGNALVLSMILHVMPQLSGGLPSELLDIIIAVADNLISCQGNANLVQNNPGALVTCVRSGYNVISGALAMGKKATIPHFQKIFKIWTRSALLIDEEKNRLEPVQSVSCLEPFVTSVLVFLQNSSELLLSVPDALNRTTQILEKLCPIILGYSQLENFTQTRLDSAKAAIMEAFAWLPSRSFPLISNSLFSFASLQIQVETKNGVSCTTLDTLLSREDDLLENRASTRIQRSGQTGQTHGEENIVGITSRFIGLSEREAVLHLLARKHHDNHYIQPSSVRSILPHEDNKKNPPTPLHEVGTWKEPPLPSRSSKERLINSAVHIFAATFNVQDSHQQTIAVKMLEDLVASKFGSRGEQCCAINVSACLLSCLKAIPLQKDSRDDSTETRSPWMLQAANVLLSILTIPDCSARRASAEGLGLLASLDDCDGTRRLQHHILRSIERLMTINVADAPTQQKPQVQAPTSISAGCLLTFGSIQRVVQQIIKSGTKKAGSVPTMVMLTRVLPHIATHSADDESYTSRTFALHSFQLLLSYSAIVEREAISLDDRKQILSKAIEVVESNFYAAWATNSTEVDVRKIESEKAAFEPSLITVLLRLMTYLVPRLYLLRHNAGSVSSRFYSMASLMIKHTNFHSSVVFEGLAFFEKLSTHRKLLAKSALSIVGTGDPSVVIASVARNILEAQRTHTLRTYLNSSFTGCEGSVLCLRGAISSISTLLGQSTCRVFNQVMETRLVCHMFALLERVLSARRYFVSQAFHTLASPQKVELSISDWKFLSLEISSLLESVFRFETQNPTDDPDRLLYWLLFSKTMLSGDLDPSSDDNIENEPIMHANEDAATIASSVGPCRWQIRYKMGKTACSALELFQGLSCEGEIIPKEDNIPGKLSMLVPHIQGLLSTACGSVVATSDQSELYVLQNVGIQMLLTIIEHFSGVVDPDADSSTTMILEEYMSQILPSVKHALSYDIDDAEDSIDTEGARELFLSGCDCLQVLVKEGLVPDSTSLKRLLKTVLPSQDMLAFSAYPAEGVDSLSSLHVKPKSFIDNRTSILIPRVASIWALAEIYLCGEIGSLQEKYFDIVKQELHSIEAAMAINTSALSIDSCKLKELKRMRGTSTTDTETLYEFKSGLTFLNVEDLDNSTTEALMRSCCAMACFGLTLILKLLKEEKCKEKLEDLLSWTDKLIAVVLAEFYACLDAFESCAAADAMSDPCSETMTFCLLVLRRVVDESSDLLPAKEARHLLLCVLKIINVGDPTEDTSEQKGDEEVPIPYNRVSSNVVCQACSFVESMCKSDLKCDVGKPFLTSIVLTPLVSFEKADDKTLATNTSNATILTSLIKSARYLVGDDDSNEQVVKGLLNFSLGMTALVNESAAPELHASLHNLIQFCLSNDRVSDKERLFYMEEMAKGGNWDAWQICLDGSAQVVSCSMRYIQDALSDHPNDNRHMSALSAIANVSKDQNHLVPLFMGGVGAHVLELFQLYGIFQLQGQRRTLACAICMKIVMFSFQYVSSREESEAGDHSTDIAFLSVVFEVLGEIVSYNGLPNQTKTNPGSDAALGRMCAQFFVHVVRSSPAVFKACMGQMNDVTRIVLETSVRADMSGYVNRSAPAKKKLNLKSFKS